MKNKFHFLLLFFSATIVNLFPVEMSITIKYLGFNVVYVTMTDNGKELLVKARSSALASIASGMDNQYSILYEDNYLPLTYGKIIEQKDYQERRIITYNRNDHSATRVSFIDSTRNSVYPIHPQTRDFFSALFYLGKNLTETGSLWLDAANLSWRADYRIIKRETINTFMGKKKTVMIELKFTKLSDSDKIRSDMLTNNLVSEKNNLYLWFTDDDLGIPVKAKFAMRPFSVVWKVTGYEN